VKNCNKLLYQIRLDIEMPMFN